MKFEWEARNARLNFAKHRITLKKSELNDWGRPEYKRFDLGEMVRGKYAKRLMESSNIVILDADVAEMFPNSAAVNKALRTLMTNRQTHQQAPRARRKKNSAAKKPHAA